jgi:hypothetical protein
VYAGYDSDEARRSSWMAAQENQADDHDLGGKGIRHMANVTNGASEQGRLQTRMETMDRLGLKASHFSKLVNGKIKGLPTLPMVKIGRRQLFRPESIEQWILDAERT